MITFKRMLLNCMRVDQAVGIQAQHLAPGFVGSWVDPLGLRENFGRRPLDR
jgi:hypothetical protein